MAGAAIPPSQAQIALAIAIVNSKPTNAAIADHIHHVCSHIKHSKGPMGSIELDRHFDSVAFWKEAYEKAEDAQSKLNDRIYDLEQRIESLKLKQDRKDVDELENSSEKRKAISDSSVSGSAKKRQKTTMIPGRQSSVTPVAGQLDGVISNLVYEEATTAPLMRHLSALQQSLHKRPTYPTIAFRAVSLCKIAGDALSNAITDASAQMLPSTSGDTLKAPDPNPISLLSVVAGSHKMLCQALNKLSNSVEGRKYNGQLIYNMTSLFERVLLALEQQCQNLAVVDSSPPSKSQNKKKTNPTKTKQPNMLTKFEKGGSNDETTEALSRLLAMMMLNGTNSLSLHVDLLEGYLYVLLNRVGTVLSTIEFQELVSNPDLRANKEKLPLPYGLLRTVTGDQSVHGVEVEAKYLVWLLEKAMAVVYSVSMKSAFEVPSDSVPSQADSGSLLRFARKKLQSTLLKAVFKENEPLFIDALQRPQLSVDTLPHLTDTNAERGSASEWFPREVWRLLGWDILESMRK